MAMTLLCEAVGYRRGADQDIAYQAYTMCSFILSLVLSVRLRIAFDNW